MGDRRYNVLFLCTGNSARSILAESVLDRLGNGKFRSFSAGSFPKGEVHPYALELLERQSYPTRQLRSKSWNEFAEARAEPLDFVFTVCDNAAGEVCPIWPGQPMTAHWGLPDPAAVEGNESVRRLAFADTLRMLRNRIGIFVSLPIKSLDKLSLQHRLREIGRRLDVVGRARFVLAVERAASIPCCRRPFARPHHLQLADVGAVDLIQRTVPRLSQRAGATSASWPGWASTAFRR